MPYKDIVYTKHWYPSCPKCGMDVDEPETIDGDSDGRTDEHHCDDCNLDFGITYEVIPKFVSWEK